MRQLKHTWNERQQEIIGALKQLLAAPPNLYVSVSSMETIQKMMLDALKERNIDAGIWETWKYFGLSGYDQDMYRHSDSSEEKTFWFLALSQGAAAAFAQEVKGRKKCDFQKDITPFFTWKIEMNTFPMFHAGGIMYDHELNTLLGNGNGHKIMRYCLECRNAERAVESACLYFLNRREYETLMELIHLCPFEPFGHFRSIVDLHFLFPNSSNGKEKFNCFYLEHFGKIEPEMWKKHHETGNLENIILPALELGASPDWYVYETENVKISLHEYCCFFDELSDELKELPCSLLYQDIRTARQYMTYLEQHGKETLK